MSKSVGVASVPATSNEATRRALSDKQARTVDKLVAAAVEELRALGYDGLTVRNVASRAGVASATAYNYFASREHLVTEVFWRRLSALADTPVEPGAGPLERVGATLADLALLVADEPELAAACTAAMLANDPDVKLLRDRIGAEMHRRLAAALGAHADPVVLRTLEFLISGALVQAGTGHLAYADLPARLTEAARLAVPAARLAS